MARLVKVQKIDDVVAWTSAMEMSEDKLIVIDCHQEW